MINALRMPPALEARDGCACCPDGAQEVDAGNELGLALKPILWVCMKCFEELVNERAKAHKHHYCNPLSRSRLEMDLEE